MHIAFSQSVLMILIAIAFLGGAAKGLAGFGGALVMAPLCSTVVAPESVTALIVFVHCATSLQGVCSWSSSVQWRVVVPFAASAVLFMFLAGLVLRGSNPLTVRHILAVCVLGVTVLHIRGWRWRHRGSWAPTLTAGLLSGAMTALGGLGGPPAFYYLNGMADGTRLRANLLAYFALLFTGSALIIVCERSSPASDVLAAAILVPVFGIGVVLGERIARNLSRKSLDRIVYALLFSSGIVALCF